MISYIIVSFNTKEFTLQTIQSICNHSNNSEIIVVDNASNDGTQEAIAKDFPNVKLIENKDNVGFSKANNMGAQIAQGEFFVFINPDTVLLSDIGNEMFDLYKDKYCGKRVILSPTILNPDLTVQHHLNLYPIKSLSLFPKHIIKSINKRTKENIRTEWITGVCLCLEKETFYQIGGWNEEFDLYMEDMEICYRMSKVFNGRVYATKRFRIVHYGNQSGKKIFSSYEREKKGLNSLRKFYSIYYNEVKFIKYLKFIYKIKRNEFVKKYCKEELGVDI